MAPPSAAAGAGRAPPGGTRPGSLLTGVSRASSHCQLAGQSELTTQVVTRGAHQPGYEVVVVHIGGGGGIVVPPSVGGATGTG